ncbi:unnamed protein product [Microthlaspi erraticum]|uniref:Uncharacterized protein n=1 Tax=Microthlaspi erraticum TaxID=1685480 RepID=A0A6D2K1I4_9BRAS|nr:unnamed protein product [Microthlaspi erraticum]
MSASWLVPMFDAANVGDLCHHDVCSKHVKSLLVARRLQMVTSAGGHSYLDEPDLRSNPFQEGGDDAIMDEEVQKKQLLAEEEDGMEQLVAAEGLEAAQLVPEEIKAIPTVPVTRSQTKALNQVIGKVLSCLSQQETKPTTLVCLEALHVE